MNKVPFQAYAIPFTAAGYQTPGLPPDVKLSHTFVTSPKYDWNCFGQGKPFVSNATLLQSGTGSAYEEWANNIYGPDSGEQFMDQSYPAAGLHVRYDGVCHNAANRVLVLAGADVSDAQGNAIVMLMYGKYGFGIQAYLQAVKDGAHKVNTDANQVVITDDEVNAAITRIVGDHTLESDTLEKELLHSHFEEQLNLQNLTPDEANSVRQVYTAFQAKRDAIFTETQAKDPNDMASFQVQYGKNMKAELLPCLGQMMEALGETKYLAMFQADPQAAVKFLLG